MLFNIKYAILRDMGERGEIFSIKTFAQHGQKTYFFNIKENRFNDIFMTVVESVRTEGRGFNRTQIAVFKEDMANFAVVLWQAQEEMKKAAELDANSDWWSSRLQSKSGKRFYQFKLINGRRGAFIVISEEKDGDEQPDESRIIKVEKEDVDTFVIGYNRARAYEEGGNADPHKPYIPKS